MTIYSGRLRVDKTPLWYTEHRYHRASKAAADCSDLGWASIVLDAFCIWDTRNLGSSKPICNGTTHQPLPPSLPKLFVLSGLEFQLSTEPLPWTATSKPDQTVVLQHQASTSLAQNLAWYLWSACPRRLLVVSV